MQAGDWRRKEAYIKKSIFDESVCACRVQIIADGGMEAP